MKVNAIKVNNDIKTITLIDQRFLPRELNYYECSTTENCYDAIKLMIVRGAPAIGITAAFGAYFALNESENFEQFKAKLEYLKSSRPTAVNLAWAVEKSADLYQKYITNEKNEISELLWNFANETLAQDIAINQKIGEHGKALVTNGMNILTHCNAGALATGGYGTALGVIRAAHEEHKNIHVFVDETRPYLQGARLTAWEMHEEKIPYTLICDNMAGFFMQKKKVDLVVTGADRIALNGDSANKIGTYSVAVLAKYHNIPFYIAAPVSTFDFSIQTGDSIPIEMRDICEITSFGKTMVTFDECLAQNPSFDVTPNSLISGIITEYGIIYPPFKENILKLRERII
ncbi:MAG: S-methyl-5-thioribose-1-phosphate isomerase [Candidatus Muiribacteriota bacterium]